MKHHEGLGIYKCLFCGTGLSSKQSLSFHEQIHVGVTSDYLQCTMCSKKLLDKRRLKLHMIKHRTKEKMEQCLVCKKEYLRKSSLRQHMRDHDVGDHKCQYCDKSFPHERYLKNHSIRIHKERSVFKCNACPAQLWSRQGVERHQQIRHNVLTRNIIKCKI